MARPQDIKPKGLAGAALYGRGNFAIAMTLIGSYGECVHRIVGGTYMDPMRCARKAAQYHREGRIDVELVNVRNGKRIAAVEFAHQL